MKRINGKLFVFLVPALLIFGATVSIGYSAWTYVTINNNAQSQEIVYRISFKDSTGNNELYTFTNMEKNSYFEFPRGVSNSFTGWTCNNGVNTYDSYSYHHLDEFSSYISQRTLTFVEYTS